MGMRRSTYLGKRRQNGTAGYCKHGATHAIRSPAGVEASFGYVCYGSYVAYVVTLAVVYCNICNPFIDHNKSKLEMHRRARRMWVSGASGGQSKSFVEGPGTWMIFDLARPTIPKNPNDEPQNPFY